MYNHQEIETKWQEKWAKDALYKTENNGKKPKYYILDMFPYPSGTGLHVGHPRGYIATDVVARYKKLQGFNVLHPMGWDAFGLPAENYALANHVHPRLATDKNIINYKRQLNLLGLSYDWSREINTTDPEYYKWTQWVFSKMFERGLVYESYEPINWCPTCLTGLANEDVEDGRCERCHTPVEKKPLRQWVIKITDYADRLLDDLDKLNDWEEPIKEMQRNWIGRSEGASIKFQIIKANLPASPAGRQKNPKSQIAKNSVIPVEVKKLTEIEVFTTRPDTIFGATYLVLAPEHEIIKNEELRIKNYKEVEDYINKTKNKSDLERTDLNKDKTGVELKGIKAINPANGEEIPIYVADYVLAGYGTGAIMAVPGHDSRDYEFATKYKLPVKQVVVSNDKEIQNSKLEINQVYCGEGLVINSDFLNGLTTLEAKDKIIAWLEDKKIGTKKVQYKLKDWVFSRQRYWGEPIPLIFCENCQSQVKSKKLKVSNRGEELNPGWFVDNNLPVKLPEIDSYEPSGTGESPLANITDWVETVCPRCGGPARRETNTMPQWAGSSWYYLAYIMSGISQPKADQPLADNFQSTSLAMTDYKEAFAQWLPVDCYVGGAEHATRHLIYARFWHKFLFDLGAVSVDEPFAKLRHVGLILAEDNRKMSKRWNNVINPDDIVTARGADTLRVYEMFMGPFGESIAWNPDSLSGARKFLDRIYKINSKLQIKNSQSQNKESTDFKRLLHKTIRKVGEDIEAFKFNTAISSLMILVNKMTESEVIEAEDWKKFLIILAPFAPHLAEELWQGQTGQDSIFKQPWPKFDPKRAKDESINLVVQINGKLRATIKVSADIGEAEAKELALKAEKIIKWLDGKTPTKVIFVKGKLVNIVVE